MEPPVAIQDSYFAQLQANRQEKTTLPLVLWRDVITPGGMAAGFRHHDFFSLYIVRQGRGTHVIDDVPYAVARGDVYAMGLGQTHWFADCHALTTETLHFAPSIFDAATLDTLARMRGFQSLFIEEPLRRTQERVENGGRWLHLTPERHAAALETVSEMRAEWESGTPEGALLTRALFVRLLVHLARAYTETGERPPSAESAHEATVAAAVRYFDAHFTDPVRVADVAARVFLSPDRFTEVFSQAMGRTPRDYLGHLRLERAKTLLRTTEQSVAAIGLESGFGDAAYFTRAFRAATGQTPREYRRMQQGF